MFQKLFKYCLFIWAAFAFAGCENTTQTNGKVVAEVGTRKLYLSDVSAVIPNNLGQADSTVMADDYIRKWVRYELVLQKAEDNLSGSLKDVSRELEEYRNSLIIFRYKNELMAQRMDTTVSDEEILQYYTQNTENFKLNKPIVKAAFIKIPADFANPDLLKEMTSDTSREGINGLRDYCLQYAKGFDIFTDRWTDLDLVLKNVPVSIENPEYFLRRNQFIEHTDSTAYYLVAIHDYKLKNEQAPVEYVSDNIKSLILNRRKIEFLRELENNIYKEAENKKSFKIYNTDTNETE
nr:hypothetical protein [Sunxiuqinia sp.]